MEKTTCIQTSLGLRSGSRRQPVGWCDSNVRSNQIFETCLWILYRIRKYIRLLTVKMNIIPFFNIFYVIIIFSDFSSARYSTVHATHRPFFRCYHVWNSSWSRKGIRNCIHNNSKKIVRVHVYVILINYTEYSIWMKKNYFWFPAHFPPAALMFILGYTGCDPAAPAALYVAALAMTGATPAGVFSSAADIAPNFAGKWFYLLATINFAGKSCDVKTKFECCWWFEN